MECLKQNVLEDVAAGGKCSSLTPERFKTIWRKTYPRSPSLSRGDQQGISGVMSSCLRKYIDGAVAPSHGGQEIKAELDHLRGVYFSCREAKNGSPA